MNRALLVALGLSSMLLGCSPMAQIKARAAFDMQCKEEQVEVIEISSFRSQYGARGCGKQASYIVRQGQAILNSPIAPIEQPAAAPPSN